MPSAEETIIAGSPNGIRVHDMGTGWHVIIAKHGERHATWYYHVDDDKRLPAALMREAERRFYHWQTVKSRARKV